VHLSAEGNYQLIIGFNIYFNYLTITLKMLLTCTEMGRCELSCF